MLNYFKNLPMIDRIAMAVGCIGLVVCGYAMGIALELWGEVWKVAR